MGYNWPDIRSGDELARMVDHSCYRWVDQPAGHCSDDAEANGHSKGGASKMTVVNTVAGSAIIIGALTLGIKAIAPPSQPIVIHSLQCDSGNVIQERTVYPPKSGEAAFFAHWTAVVVNAETKKPVPGCEGSDDYPYPSGYLRAEMTLQRWVKSDDCDPAKLEPGKYYLLGAWSWGHESTSATSPVFEVKP